jgi:hypothetical protein
MSKRIIRTVVNRKWEPLEIGNRYGDFTVDWEIGFTDKGLEYDPEYLAWFVAQMALHNGVLQANDQQAELPWAMPIAWRQGKLRGAGMLKLDRLWKPKNVRFDRVGKTPEAEREGYTFLSVAQLALMELTAAMPASLAGALKSEPAGEDEAEERLEALLYQYNARTWGTVDWFVCQVAYSNEADQRKAISLRFTDDSELFITAYGLSLEPPRWLDGDDTSPGMLRAADLKFDTICLGTA